MKNTPLPADILATAKARGITVKTSPTGTITVTTRQGPQTFASADALRRWLRSVESLARIA